MENQVARVAVVVSTRDRSELLQETLQSIRDLERDGIPFESIFGDTERRPRHKLLATRSARSIGILQQQDRPLIQRGERMAAHCSVWQAFAVFPSRALRMLFSNSSLRGALV